MFVDVAGGYGPLLWHHCGGLASLYAMEWGAVVMHVALSLHHPRLNA